MDTCPVVTPVSSRGGRGSGPRGLPMSQRGSWRIVLQLLRPSRWVLGCGDRSGWFPPAPPSAAGPVSARLSPAALGCQPHRSFALVFQHEFRVGLTCPPSH